MAYAQKTQRQNRNVPIMNLDTVSNNANSCEHSLLKKRLTKAFRRFAQKLGKAVGTPWSFGIALLFVVLWLVSGPIFSFSASWQLVINTTTTIVTFLMVFLLQNTQNRDTKALHLKLDELIYVNKKARNALLEAEEMLDDEQMQKECNEFRNKRERSNY